MTTDDELDAFLVAHLSAPPLPDDGFARAVTERVLRSRRRRRWALAGATGVAGVVAALALHAVPSTALALPDLAPGTVLGALLLTAACCLVWIGTEAGPGRRAASHG